MSGNNVYTRYYTNQSVKADAQAEPLFGIYVGIVRSALDEHRSGRYEVEIPALNKGGAEPTDGEKRAPETHPCVWTSPFAGATNPEKLGKNEESYVETLKSYGMWMPPPDEGNLVLVAFGDGNSKLGYIISCIFPDKLTHMVPGMPAGKSYSDPSLAMPVAEKSKYDSEKQTHNDATRPLHVDIAEGITLQGLINDPLRGAGQSGSRNRSDFNEVYGILTPGPKDPDLPKDSGHRMGGHQFVMDDNLKSRLIRLRTAGGNQLLMDDTSGIVYIINRKGTAWFEMSNNGDIYMHSEGTIAMRAKGNFDLRADKNINIEAGQNLHLKAAGDNVSSPTGGSDYLGIPALGALGIPPLGNGGNIRFEATADLSAYAGLNAQMTANGGGIDLSAASHVFATAGGPLGIHLFSATGPLQMQSTQATSILTPAQFNVTAPGGFNVLAAKILLNSGGAPALPCAPATPAPQIGTNAKKDNPHDAPKFDREAAMAGQTAAPTAGTRVGTEAEVQTIVSKLITSEPYQGHGQLDPIAESAKAPAPDPNLIKDLPSASIDLNGNPVSVATPEGYVTGNGYTDQNGNPITDIASTIQNQAQGLADQASGALGGAQSAIDGAIGDAQGAIDGALNDISGGAIPNFEGLGDIASNLQSLATMDLTSIQGLAGLVTGLQAVLPPIRFPTSNPISEKVIGVMKQLKEMEAQLSAFALDALNLPVDLDLDKIANMRSQITDAIAQATGSADLANLLSEKGITMIKDGPGTIFQDALGNKLIDFSSGLGPAGATLGLVGDLNSSFKTVQSAIETPLTQNETLAISNFTRAVGSENFLKSDVLKGLNSLKDVTPGNTIEYAVKKGNVLREMQSWVTAPSAPGEASTVQSGLQGMRRFEAILFQCPDSMDVSSFINSDGYLPGSTNFDTLADDLQRALDAHLAGGP